MMTTKSKEAHQIKNNMKESIEGLMRTAAKLQQHNGNGNNALGSGNNSETKNGGVGASGSSHRR